VELLAVKTYLLDGVTLCTRDAQIADALEVCRQVAPRDQGVTKLGLCNEAGDVYRGVEIENVGEFVAVHQALAELGLHITSISPGRGWQVTFG
jgi:hypothetical protein